MKRKCIDEIIAQNAQVEELKEVLSDHFDCIEHPVSVSLGVHLKKGQTVEVVTNLLRESGINALPYYDKNVENDYSCSVVDGTGIRSPIFEKSEDAVKFVADVFQILQSNNIETSRAFPISRENLIPAVTKTYNDNTIDIQQNNPKVENVDEILARYIEYAQDKMPEVSLPTGKSQEHIYRGGFLGDNPYAITFHRRYRDCAYATNMMSEAITYSQASNKNGLHYKEINGVSYGFIYEYKQGENQRFYDMAGAERPFATPEQKHTINRPEYRLDYETPILKERNPLSAIYLRVGEKVVQIADEQGYIRKDDMDWGQFAQMHTPYNMGEMNEYLVNRANKQVEEFPTVAYTRDKTVGEYDRPMNLQGLVHQDCIMETENNGVEIQNAVFSSLKLSQPLDKVQLTGNLSLLNCTLSERIDALDISKCEGMIMMCNMDYINVKLPERCNCFALSGVTFPQMDTLDLSGMKCKSMVLEDVDLSAVKHIKFPQEMEELKLKYDIKFPQSADLDGVKKINVDSNTNVDLSKTDEHTARRLTNILKVAELRERINQLRQNEEVRTSQTAHDGILSENSSTRKTSKTSGVVDNKPCMIVQRNLHEMQ